MKNTNRNAELQPSPTDIQQNNAKLRRFTSHTSLHSLQVDYLINHLLGEQPHSPIMMQFYSLRTVSDYCGTDTHTHRLASTSLLPSSNDIDIEIGPSGLNEP